MLTWADRTKLGMGTSMVELLVVGVPLVMIAGVIFIVRTRRRNFGTPFRKGPPQKPARQRRVNPKTGDLFP